MHTKAGRDVLYFENTNQIPNNTIKNNILQKSKETPPHFNNQNRGCPCLLFRHGSITVEAAFGATVFFLALFSLLYLFVMLQSVCRIHMRLAVAAQQYECFGTKMGMAEGTWKRPILIQWDKEKGVCYVKHSRQIPFLGAQFFEVSFYQQMRISDYSGRSMVSADAVLKEYVYISENGTVYHRDRGCIYLNPGIKSIRYAQVDSQRNRSGGKYGHCKSCCKDSTFTAEQIVYITPYGDCYHQSKQCSGLKRTIRKVLLSETGGMPACSKCAERRNGENE